MNDTTKIIIVDDHQIYREGLKLAAGNIKGVSVIGVASNGIELLDLLQKNTPDIILMDIEMPEMNGIEASRRVKSLYPDIKIIAITMFDEIEYMASIIDAGVNCFLLKNTTREELERAIKTVLEGKLLFPIHLSKISNLKNFNIMKTSKILLVDDDIDIITTLETILTKKGYNVITANNKVEGMKKIKEEKPDMAILDVMMTTQYEGFEMAKEINDDKSLDDMPVLMLTSIDVLITSNTDLQKMVRDFRKNPGFKDLHVLLVKDIVSGKAGIDYLSENNKSIWFPVSGFIRKPVESSKILPEIEKILQN
ncbi:MAG: response regulator [Bacteroidetes bacterium]|nr:response regulator [Bacteroidota bacterium]